MIDVHVLLRGGENHLWLMECLNSLQGHPINLFVEPGIEGDLNKARIDAIGKGSAEFVSFADPDDIVMPGAFQACLDAVGDHGGAYTRELLIREDGSMIGENKQPGTPRTNPMVAHHVVMVRRSIAVRMEPLIRQHKFGCWWMLCAAADVLGGMQPTGTLGYKWRMHRNNSFVRPQNRVAREVVAELVRGLEA